MEIELSPVERIDGGTCQASHFTIHITSRSGTSRGLNSLFLLSKPEWSQYLKALNAGIQLVDHRVICCLSNVYHLHLCDDYTFLFKMLIKVLNRAKPRIAPYATSVQSLQCSSASSSKIETYNMQCAKPTDGMQATSKEQLNTKICPAAFWRQWETAWIGKILQSIILGLHLTQWRKFLLCNCCLKASFPSTT